MKELRFVAAVVCVAAVGLLVHTNRLQLESVFGLPPLNADFHWYARPPLAVDASAPGYGPDSPMTRAIFDDRAIVQCDQPLQLSGHVDPAKALASRTYLNERYTDGWQSDASPVEVDQATGLAYVTVAAGTVGKFSFWFVPPGLVSGFVLFAIGAVSAVGALFARRRRQASLRF